MRNNHHTIIIFLIVISVLSCASYKNRRIETVNPILKLQVIEIESKATIQGVEGQAFVKQSDSNSYAELRPGSQNNFDDIIEVKKISTVYIRLEDSTIIKINSNDRDDWFIIEKADKTRP